MPSVTFTVTASEAARIQTALTALKPFGPTGPTDPKGVIVAYITQLVKQYEDGQLYASAVQTIVPSTPIQPT